MPWIQHITQNKCRLFHYFSSTKCMSMSYGTHYAVTIYPDGTGTLSQCLSDVFGFPKVKFIIGQEEVCPQTGRDHYQVFVSFVSSVRADTFRKRLQRIYPGSHVEICNGSVRQNIEYCSKEESRKPGTSPISLGKEPVSQGGTRTDLEEVSRYTLILVMR